MTSPNLEIRRVRWAVSLIFLANGLSFASLVPHFPWLKEKLMLSEATMGIALLFPAIGAVTMMLLTGRLIQRFGSKALTILGGLVLQACVPLILLMPDLWTLAPLLVGVGAMIGMMDVSMNAQAAVVESRYGKPIMSSFHATWSLGTLTGGASASLLLGVGLTPLQHVTSITVFLFVLILVCGKVLLPHSEDIPGDDTPVIAIPKGPVLAMGLLAMMGMVSEGAATDWSAIYASTVLEATPSQAAATFTVFTLTMTTGRFTGDWLVRRFGRARMVQIAAGLGAGGLAIGLAGGTLESAWFGFACLGFGLANVVPILFSASSQIPGVSAGTGIAGVATLGYFGFLFGPPLIGFTAEWLGLRVALFLIVAFCLVLALVAPRLLGASASPAPAPSKA
jgi:MFS family permease